MVNSNGAARLIELTIAIVIIIAMLLIAYRRTGTEQKGEDLTEISRDILREIASKDSLRNEVVTSQTNVALMTNTLTFVNDSLPDYVLFELRACESGIACGQSAYQGEVYSAERIFGATSTNFNTVKLRLFLWIGE